MRPWKTKKESYISDEEAGKRYHAHQEEAKKLHKAPIPTNDQLKSFHARAQAGEDRLSLLKEMSGSIIKVLGIALLKKRRRSFNSIKNSKFPTINRPCWVCGMPSWERHHVIQLQNGGPVTSSKNVVLLCQKCHSDVHPWMGYARPMLLPDYNLAFFKSQATGLLEKAAKGRVAMETAEIEILDYLHSVFNTLQ